jgi:hypothetical protein
MLERVLAIPGRLELPTYGLGNRRSIRLSYGTECHSHPHTRRCDLSCISEPGAYRYPALAGKTLSSRSGCGQGSGPLHRLCGEFRRGSEHFASRLCIVATPLVTLSRVRAPSNQRRRSLLSLKSKCPRSLQLLSRGLLCENAALVEGL